MTSRDWAEWAGVALYALAVYQASREDDGMTEARILRAVSRACQKTAEKFGKWGIATELEYRRILERERMN